MSIDEPDRGFRVRVEGSGPGAVVAVHGAVDLATAPQLATALDVAAAGRRRVVDLDLSGVEFFACCGATAVQRAAERASRRGGRLRVVGCRRPARVVLHAAGLDRLLEEPIP